MTDRVAQALRELREMRERLETLETMLTAQDTDTDTDTDTVPATAAAFPPPPSRTSNVVADMLAKNPDMTNAEIVAALEPYGHNAGTIRTLASRHRSEYVKALRAAAQRTSTGVPIPLADHYVTQVAPGDSNNGIGPIGRRWIGGLCHAAWQTFDELTPVGGRPLPNRADVVALGQSRGLNVGNLNYEFPRWKKFNGF